MNIPINIYKDTQGNFIAESNLLPGFHTYGKDQNKLQKNLQELLVLYKELIKNGDIKQCLKVSF